MEEGGNTTILKIGVEIPTTNLTPMVQSLMCLLDLIMSIRTN